MFREASVETNDAILDVYYTTNPMKAAAFKIALDERRDTESLETLLKRVQYRVLGMYRRLRPPESNVQRPAKKTREPAVEST
ncbi:hypothetical protein AVEN_116756-1 [Araneus ventricosus]|uniref:Uncharacterized protein n=1 Tax=Araneus ventricosus TaxID=182803 RepID=A0A4Y2QEG6_ARAVE|nr:hypothetical protein AVEN_116756-1 [Araneus ventricosus]